MCCGTVNSKNKGGQIMSLNLEVFDLKQRVRLLEEREEKYLELIDIMRKRIDVIDTLLIHMAEKRIEELKEEMKEEESL